MKLDVGAKAPSFEVEDARGKVWDVPRNMGDRYLALVFLRHLGCPLCMRRIDEISNDIPRFDSAGADVLVVVESTPARVKSYTDKKGLRVALVGDRDKNLYRGFGVERGDFKSFLSPNVLKASVKATLKGYMHGKFEGDELQKPAEFIISPSGKIAWAHYGKDISDSTASDMLLRQLEDAVRSKK